MSLTEVAPSPTVPLKRMARVRYGLGQPPPERPTGVPILRATNIQRGRIVEKGMIFADLADLPSDRAPLLEAGEILVVRSGANTGDSALVPERWAGAAPGYDLRLTPLPHVDPRFLAYCLLSLSVSHQIAVERSRAAQPHLNAEDLGNLRVPCPSLYEQTRIADFLDVQIALLDGAVELRQQHEALLIERRRVAVLVAVSGHDLSGDRVEGSLPWVGSTPAAWPISKITYHARLGSGHTPSRSRPEWWETCTIPWITTGEVAQVRNDRQEEIAQTRERISELGIANSSAEVHPRGTVVLSRTASAGFSAVMAEDMATSQDFVTWTCGPGLDPYYLLWCLRAMRPDLLGRLAMGSTHKTIYVPDIQTLKIPLPSRDEQSRIVRDIREHNAYIDRLMDLGRHQVRLFQERRQSLISAAVAQQFDATTARSVA